MLETPVPFRILPNTVSLPVDGLRIGMFVSGIDCGWHKTGFPLEGVSIRSAEDIAGLRAVAREVIVDTTRSSPAAFTMPELQAMATRIGATVLQPSLDSSSVRSESDDRFHRFISTAFAPEFKTRRSRLAERLRAWWEEHRASVARAIGAPVARPMPASAKPSYIPDDVSLVIYRPPEPMPESLAAAKQAYRHVESAMQHVDLQLNEPQPVPDGTGQEAVRHAADTLVDNMILRPATMMWVAKLRASDAVRYQQAVRVAVHLTALGRQIGFQKEQLADLANIGLLLDVGKIDLPPDLLNKAGPLSETDADMLRSHVRVGLEMLSESHQLPAAVLQAIAEHHERLDGSGYPAGLDGSQISIYGKMAAIVDAYVAMTNPRPYAPTLTPYDAIRELFRNVNTGFFGPLVEQFVQAIGIFPVGSLIELSTGQVAIVVQHNPTRRLEPKLLVLTAEDKALLDEPWELDLLRHNAIVREEIHIVRGLTEGTYGIDFRNYYLNQRAVTS